MSDLTKAITLLRSPQTIRERSKQLFDRAMQGQSSYFAIDLTKLAACCDYVLELTKQNQPDLNVPFHSRWRHFEVGGIDRLAQLKKHQQFPKDTLEQGRLFYELTIISVLLDAGAGSQWQYFERASNQHYDRSEGLAIASFDMFIEGLFSSDTKPQADYVGLKNIDELKIAKAMQVTEANPLNGLAGRSQLIQSLATVMENHPEIFAKTQRLGALYDHIVSQAKNNTINAADVLAVILKTFATIWPGRISLDNENLGDVWQHSAIQGTKYTEQLIPFHKLSQWLSYSLLEPLQWQGFQITGLEQLTGLAEYRNGGLMIDFGLLLVKDQHLLEQPQAADSEAIIEWRAITICLLDLLWHQALEQLNKNAQQFPLVAFLEAGTWKAGRALAKQKRPESCSPPISIVSDGTVF